MQHHALQTALTLYSGGTFTLEQAADHAGMTPSRMAACLEARDIAVSTPVRSVDPATPNAPTSDPSTPDTAGESRAEGTSETLLDGNRQRASVRTDGSGEIV